MDKDFEILRKKAFEFSTKAIDKEFTKDRIIVILTNSLEEIQKAKNIVGVKIKEIIETINPNVPLQSFIKEGYSTLEKRKNSFIPSSLKEMKKIIENLREDYIKLEKTEYLIIKKIEELMKECCPNLLAIAGKSVGAKLLKRAGSLKRLASMPSSTIQLLGAEKALFRHLKKGTKPPKYGYLYQHELVQKAKKNKKGKVSRILGEVISLAVRIDYFSNRKAEKELKEILEKKLKKIIL